ncbi:MAG: hypothetical protein CL677_04990 [Bdellovibrionaceae bacterium]|nr:hypothetical protein [Pseudobdellovibrionaceae bacterium]|tara:strand:- start:112199 stop:113233 length:1035 start_codon:yes stop_codon:yes gene_type:complete
MPPFTEYRYFMGCNVNQFVKFLEQTDEQKNAQRFTIYNFFSTYLSPKKELSASDIEQFYLTALRYSHWQANIPQLTEQFKDLLMRFGRKAALQFEPEEVAHADQWQLIQVDSRDNQHECLERFLERHYSQSEDIEYRVIALSDGRQASLIKGKERIRVNVFSNTWYLKKGELVPMNPVTQLTYDLNLDFIGNTGQFIEINPHTQFYFNSNQIFYGCYLRGYSMQKAHPVQFRSFSELPEIYRTLKSLESNYVSTTTDPEYQNLVRLLDKATQMLTHNTAGAGPFAAKAFHQGQFALQNLFPNDKYLHLLLSQLELALMKENSQEPKSWQWHDLKNRPSSDLTNT